MGKSLIIKGADFSANGIQESVELDISSLVDASGNFYPCAAVNSFGAAAGTANTARCELLRLSIAALVADLTPYSKIRIDIKSGYDFALGMCRSSDFGTWFKLDGTSDSGGSLSWVTDKQYAEVSVSPAMYITGNFRHDDNTTTFSNTTKFSDIASIKLIS